MLPRAQNSSLLQLRCIAKARDEDQIYGGHCLQILSAYCFMESGTVYPDRWVCTFRRNMILFFSVGMALGVSS